MFIIYLGGVKTTNSVEYAISLPQDSNIDLVILTDKGCII